MIEGSHLTVRALLASSSVRVFEVLGGPDRSTAMRGYDDWMDLAEAAEARLRDDSRSMSDRLDWGLVAMTAYRVVYGVDARGPSAIGPGWATPDSGFQRAEERLREFAYRLAGNRSLIRCRTRTSSFAGSPTA